MKKIVFLIIIWQSFIAYGQQNLIPNGGFEEYSNNAPVNWFFGRYLNLEKSFDSYEGNYAAKVYPNGGSIYLITTDYKYNVLDVKPNSEYTFSYAYKGEVTDDYGNPKKNILVSITWYRDDQKIKTDYYDDDLVYLNNIWQQKQINLQVPVGVNKAGVAFKIKENKTGHIILDDVAMVFKKDLEELVPTPTNVKVTPYQREIEVNWDKEADSNIQWELKVNDRDAILTGENSYIVDDLDLNTEYQIKIRAKKFDMYSEYTQIYRVKTQNLDFEVNDLERIPRLRTLGIDGFIPQEIKLYYTDLADKNAEIEYFIDNQKVTPQGNTLTFMTLGKHKLKVLITESDGLKWKLHYSVNVTD